MPTKNINAEKIQGNLDVNGLSATTFNVNGQYDLPTNSPTNGDFFMYSGGSSSWNFIETSSITGTTGGTIPFVNDIGTDFDYKSGFNYDLNNLNITSAPNKGVVIDKAGGITISGNTGGVIILSGNNDTLSAATISSDNDLVLYATGTTPSVYGQDKQLYLSSSNPYVGINTNTPQAILHVKGNSNTTGQALLIHNGTSARYAVQVYNNHDTINSGVTYNTVGVNFNRNDTNQGYYYSLPTISGKTNYVLTRVQPIGGNNIGNGKFNTFWHDYRQGNQYWNTGLTNNGDIILIPSLPDVEAIVNPTQNRIYKNVFAYDTASKTYIESYDNFLQIRDSIIMNSANKRRKMTRCFVSGGLMDMGNTTIVPNIDNSFNMSNVFSVGQYIDINNGGTSFNTTGVSNLEEKTSVKNLLIAGTTQNVTALRDSVVLARATVAITQIVGGGENIYVIGSTQNLFRQRKKEPPYLNDTKPSLNVKNIWSFGGGFNGQHKNNILVFDNTINIGTVSHGLLQGGGTYYANVPTKNIYDTPWPYQTKGIWIGTKKTYSANPVAGFWLDPLIEDNGNLNFGFGTNSPFYPTDSFATKIIDSGLNRPKSGAGIFYLHKPYLESTSASNTSVPRSYYNNAVGLGNNEQYYVSPLSDGYQPAQNSSLVIHSGEGIIHLIGQGMYVNPVKEVINKPVTAYSGSTYQLSGSSAMLDVTGSGSTSSTTSVRIKNSGDNVGLEVLDGTTTTTPNALDVYFNGIPSSDAGLAAGYLYKNGSGQLSIVTGASVAGNYENAIDEQFLELRLLSQTQVYSNLGTTVISDGVLVQQINDLSGKNNDATQTNSGNRLTWNVSVSTLNNYSYLSNADTSRFMNLTNGLSLSASSVDDTGFCMTVVMKINNTDTFRLFESSTTDDFIGEFSYNGITNHCNWTHSGSTNSVTSIGSGAESSYILGDWAVFSFFINAGENSLNSYINNENNQKIDITTNVFRNLNRILVGGNIEVAEFTLYNNPKFVSASNPGVDLTSEVQRLMTKYNIT